jgi:hypothetical protein
MSAAYEKYRTEGPGPYALGPGPITHYTVLATIEAAYRLPRDGQAAAPAPVTNIWLP